LTEQQENINDSELLRENMELKARVRQLEDQHRKMYEHLENNFTILTNKYKESTLKECKLLTDRFRLERKHAERC
jgi:hypothetical protein